MKRLAIPLLLTAAFALSGCGTTTRIALWQRGPDGRCRRGRDRLAQW